METNRNCVNKGSHKIGNKWKGDSFKGVKILKIKGDKAKVITVEGNEQSARRKLKL